MADRKAKILSWAGTAAVLVFLAFAIGLFAHTVRHYEMQEVMARLRQIPGPRLALAGLCVALCYAVQTGYDFLAARSIGVGVSPGRAALAAFVGNSLTNNIGLAVLTGTSIRYRYYMAWGFGAVQIAQIVVLSKLAFISGLGVSTGLSQIFAPVRLPDLPFSLSPRVLGFLLLIPAVSLLLWNGFARGGTLALGKFRLQRPRQGLLAMQIAVSCAHFAFAAGALYYLLPDGDLKQAGFGGPWSFLGTFMAIKFAAMFLPVPGNLGVLEAAAMAVLTPALPPYPVLGALLAFRISFYLAPFALALATLAVYEVASGKGLLPSLLRRRREAAAAFPRKGSGTARGTAEGSGRARPRIRTP